MARILTVVLAVAALLAVGHLTHAAPSTPEEYWRTVLPDSPLPEAVSRLLHPGSEAHGSPSQSSNDILARKMSTLPIFYYMPRIAALYDKIAQETKDHGSDEHSSSVSSDDVLAKKMSTFPIFYYMPRIAALYDKIAQGKHLSHPTSAVATNHETKEHGSDKRSSSVSSDDILAKKMSTFPIFYYMPRIAALYNKIAQGKDMSRPEVSNQADHYSMDNITFFFRENEVRVGNNMHFYFPPAQTSPLGLLPRGVADSIPFSSSSLPRVLSHFGIPVDSSLAASMELTLEMCEMPPHSVGEVQFCATSLEALVDGVVAAFGTRDISPVTSDMPYSGSPPLQPYAIRAVRPIDGSTFLSCHYLDYPYTVYACHTVRSTRAYKMEMEGLSGNAVTLAVVCHADTSGWDPNFVGFKILGGKPGGAPICHFVPYGNIIWGKKASSSSA